MKGLLISFLVGLLVGVAYGLIRVKSPAPPIVALIGLLGMVLGEQAVVWLVAKKAEPTNTASVHIIGKHRDRQRPSGQFSTSTVNRRNLQ
jgi:XapX domain-containing protein